jgi:hypothetical protein
VSGVVVVDPPVIVVVWLPDVVVDWPVEVCKVGLVVVGDRTPLMQIAAD